MKKYLSYIILTVVLSIITVLITVFIYSPQFAKEREFLAKKVGVFTYQNKRVELDRGEVGVPILAPTFSPTPSPAALLVIVLDDFGYEEDLIDILHELSLPINPSIIPFLPASEVVLKKAKEYGLDPLLHLPMEPINPSLNPGKGAIYVTFSDKEIRERTKEALEAMPGVIGVNNHMGSRATASKRVMKDVIDVIKVYNLFFLDSLTTPFSVGYEVAQKAGLPLLKRDIFLDNYKEEDYIEGQLDEFTKLALERKKAIGIGHANKITLFAIKKYIPIWKEKNIKIISLKDYVKEGLWREDN